eukprot:gene6373-7343_t
MSSLRGAPCGRQGEQRRRVRGPAPRRRRHSDTGAAAARAC